MSNSSVLLAEHATLLSNDNESTPKASSVLATPAKVSDVDSYSEGPLVPRSLQKSSPKFSRPMSFMAASTGSPMPDPALEKTLTPPHNGPDDDSSSDDEGDSRGRDEKVMVALTRMGLKRYNASTEAAWIFGSQENLPAAASLNSDSRQSSQMSLSQPVRESDLSDTSDGENLSDSEHTELRRSHDSEQANKNNIPSASIHRELVASHSIERKGFFSYINSSINKTIYHYVMFVQM